MDILYIRYWLLIALGSILLPSLSVAQDQSAPDAWLIQGNAAYEVEQYDLAIQWYDSVLTTGFHSAQLYYNLGNAHYQLGDIAPAILNYERALQLDPGNEDATYNLQLANLRVVDNITPIPRLLLMQQLENTYQARTSGQWAWLGLWMLVFALGLGCAFLFLENPLVKRIGFFGGILFLVFSLVSIALAFQQDRNKQDLMTGPAIVTAANAYVKDAPNGKTDLLILHEGVKVEQVESKEGWTKITLTDANIGEVVGFVDATSIERI
ncbi:MAG: tetratricopeptide repeat protein [Bacteroidota bacterium]